MPQGDGVLGAAHPAEGWLSVKQKHPQYDGMFFAVYPDGVRSADFYNAARAAEHTAVLAVTARRDYYTRLRPSVVPCSDYSCMVGASSV